MSTTSTRPDHDGRTRRRWAALLLSPLVVAPFIFLADFNYLQRHGEKFWLDDLLYLVIVSYLGSAIAGMLVGFVLRLRGAAVSGTRVTAIFVTISVASAFVVLAWASRNLVIGLVGAGVVAIGSAAVGLSYSIIAGLPWRTSVRA